MHSVCMGIITLKPELLRYAVQLGENISTVPTIGALRLLRRSWLRRAALARAVPPFPFVWLHCKCQPR